MFSLIITIVAIALVAALALATIYYGGTAFNKGAATAAATRAISQGQQIQGAMDLFNADFGRWPRKEEILGDNEKGFVYLRSWPENTVKTAALGGGSAVTQAVAQAASEANTGATVGNTWRVPTNPVQPTAVLSDSVSQEVCAQINQLSRGDDGIANVVSTSYATQCFSPDRVKFVVVVTKAGQAALTTGLNDGGPNPPTVDTTPLNVGDPTDPVWVKPPGIGAPPPPPSPTPSGPGAGTAAAWSLEPGASGIATNPRLITQQGAVATVEVGETAGPSIFAVKLVNTGSAHLKMADDLYVLSDGPAVAFGQEFFDVIGGGAPSSLVSTGPICASGQLLAPGGSCAVIIQMQYLLCGFPASSPMLLTSPSSPASVTLKVQQWCAPIEPTYALALQQVYVPGSSYSQNFTHSRYNSTGYSTELERMAVAVFNNQGNAPVTVSSVTVGSPFYQLTGAPSDCVLGGTVAVGGNCVVRFVLPSTVPEGVLQQSTVEVAIAEGAPASGPISGTLASEPWRRTSATASSSYVATGFLNSLPLPVNGAVLKNSDGSAGVRVSNGMPLSLVADLSITLSGADFEVRSSDMSDTCAAISYGLPGGTSCEFRVSLTAAARSAVGLHTTEVTVSSSYGTSTVPVQVFVVDTTPAIVDLETRIQQEYQAAVQAGAGVTAALQGLLDQMVAEIRKQWPAP